MVRIHPDPPILNGAVAQLGEHLLCKQGVVGSIPISSTIYGIGGQGSPEDRAKRWHRASVSLWFLTRSYRLFFNNVEEVKVLLLPAGLGASRGLCGWSEIGLDCIDPFSP